jgi:hypothetical protein
MSSSHLVAPPADADARDLSLSARLATAPGLVRAGASRWDDGRTPVHPMGLPFAFVRTPGYRGHEIHKRPVRGADVAGRRVLLMDGAVSSGTAVERFTAALAAAGDEVVDAIANHRTQDDPRWDLLPVAA